MASSLISTETPESLASRSLESQALQRSRASVRARGPGSLRRVVNFSSLILEDEAWSYRFYPFNSFISSQFGPTARSALSGTESVKAPSISSVTRRAKGWTSSGGASKTSSS